jgi:hypothetical protein
LNRGSPKYEAVRQFDWELGDSWGASRMWSRRWEFHLVTVGNFWGTDVVDILTGIHNVSIVLSTRPRVIHPDVHSDDGKNRIPAPLFLESGLCSTAHSRNLVFPLCSILSE